MSCGSLLSRRSVIALIIVISAFYEKHPLTGQQAMAGTTAPHIAGALPTVTNAPADTQNATDTPSIVRGCSTLIPVTGIGAGFLSAELNCPSLVSWSVEPGVALFGFTQPEAYLRGTLGLSYPPPKASSTAVDNQTIRIRTSLSYALIRSQSFQSLTDAQPVTWFTSPGLQQWALLLNTKISSELLIPTTTPQAFFTSCGFEFWQTLPRQWRGLGAIKHTRKAHVSGLQLKGYQSLGSWSLSAGLGLTSVALAQTVFSFVHPTMDVTYRLEEKQ